MGYRKKAKDPVSPRALKHLNDLMMLSNEGTYRTIMCYVIQREDVSSFQPSVIDEAYRNMFYKACYFNKSINSWNVSNVTCMRCMFYYAVDFNQELNKWNTKNVIDMSNMLSVLSYDSRPIKILLSEENSRFCI